MPLEKGRGRLGLAHGCKMLISRQECHIRVPAIRGVLSRALGARSSSAGRHSHAGKEAKAPEAPEATDSPENWPMED